MLENTAGAIKEDNPEKLATQGTQDTRQIHVREYLRGNTKGQFRETGNIDEIGCRNTCIIQLFIIIIIINFYFFALGYRPILDAMKSFAVDSKTTRMPGDLDIEV